MTPDQSPLRRDFVTVYRHKNTAQIVYSDQVTTRSQWCSASATISASTPNKTNPTRSAISTPSIVLAPRCTVQMASEGLSGVGRHDRFGHWRVPSRATKGLLQHDAPLAWRSGYRIRGTSTLSWSPAREC